MIDIGVHHGLEEAAYFTDPSGRVRLIAAEIIAATTPTIIPSGQEES